MKRKADDSEYDFDINEHIKIFEEKLEEDFSIFYTKNYNKLVFHNRRYINDPVIAEDMASKSFMKALKKIRDYNKDKAKFSTWLYTISKHDCLQLINKEKRYSHISIDKPLDEEGTTIKDFLEYDADRDIQLIDEKELRAEKGKILRSKIPFLKEPYKNVITLREIEDYSYRDITILLRENLTLDWVIELDDRNYEDGILTLVDPEKKRSKKMTGAELAKLENIKRKELGLPLIKFHVDKSDKSDKEDFELVKIYSLDYIIDENGNEAKYEILEYDKDKLITKIRIAAGTYCLSAVVPFQMSTLKSQIHNGRKNLQELVEEEFNELDKIYDWDYN